MAPYIHRVYIACTDGLGKNVGVSKEFASLMAQVLPVILLALIVQLAPLAQERRRLAGKARRDDKAANTAAWLYFYDGEPWGWRPSG